MSLSQALLLDPLRMNVWIAVRTDGIAGSGSQNDPYDGSTATKFDAVMNAVPILVSIVSSTNTATVTAMSHGYANNSVVLIAGATNSNFYNGIFQITVTGPNTFTYTMSGSPGAPAQGVVTCRLSQSTGPLVPLPVNPPIAVRLGPGTFLTNGYCDSVAAGWQTRPAMKIVGCGADVTILKAAGSATGATAHFYAIGHAVSPGNLPNPIDYFEACDFTIDCNLAGFSGSSAASGAVRILGNHARLRRLKVINWGTKSTSNPCFVLSTITATNYGSVEDCGIDECLAINPATTGNAGPMTVFHAGGTEVAPTSPLAFGIAPYIRNCFVDGSPSSLEIRGVSMALCKAGILEGNQAHNVTYGTFHQAGYGTQALPTNAQDIVVRNNWFKNVTKGVLLGGVDNVARSGSLVQTGSLVTVTLSGTNDILTGDWVAITTDTGPFNGVVAKVIGIVGSTFKFNTSVPGNNTANVTAVRKVFGATNLTVEGNVVELATATSGSLMGIHIQDGSLATTAQDTTYPLYVFSNVIVRDNKLRYLDGQINGGFAGYPLQVNSAMNLLVRNNVVESDPANPVRNDRCQSVAYFNNMTPAGVLRPGWNSDNSTQYEELSTFAEFALIMGLFNRKS